MPNWTPEQLADYNRRNKAAIRAADKGMNDRFDISLPPSKFKALPLPAKPRKPLLNKTEARFLDLLKEQYPGRSIGIQSITLKLSFDCRYTPDFWIVPDHVNDCDILTSNTALLRFYEVKGPFIREDSIIKLKTAAAMFQRFEFILAQYKDGKWTTKTIPTI